MSSTIKVYLLYLSCFCSLIGLAVPSHFRGGIIQWRPANELEFDGRVRLTYKSIRKTIQYKFNKKQRLKVCIKLPKLSSFCNKDRQEFFK